MCNSSPDVSATITDGTDHADEIFNHVDASSLRVSGASFRGCTFRNSNFLHAQLADCRFDDCRFEDSDLSLARLRGTVLSDVTFASCKLVGVDWSDASGICLSVEFAGCVLDDCAFPKLSLRRLKVVNCTVRRSDFVECDLSEADFSGSDLEGARFQNCNLRGADFASALNYTIDLRANDAKDAVFSLPEAVSLLTSLGARIRD